MRSIEFAGYHSGGFRVRIDRRGDHAIGFEVKAKVHPADVTAIVKLRIRQAVERVVLDFNPARRPTPHCWEVENYDGSHQVRLSGIARKLNK